MAKTNADYYQEYTDRIVAMLEAGELPPWRKPWDCPGGFVPMNGKSGRQYRGINVWWLLMAAQAHGFTSNVWLTFKQVAALGGRIKPEAAKKNGGPGPTNVILWKPARGKDRDANGDETQRAYLLIRSYRVWNLDQTEGVELPAGRIVEPEEAPSGADIDARAEGLLADYYSRESLTVDHGGAQAFYSPVQDRIQLPERESFHGTAGYYSTAFHEAGHSTGHRTRLGREGIANPSFFGSHAYSREELVAEFTAAFLCGVTGVSVPEIEGNQAAYLKHWAARLKSDPKILINAAAAAQKASDYILGTYEARA